MRQGRHDVRDGPAHRTCSMSYGVASTQPSLGATWISLTGRQEGPVPVTPSMACGVRELNSSSRKCLPARRHSSRISATWPQKGSTPGVSPFGGSVQPNKRHDVECGFCERKGDDRTVTLSHQASNAVAASRATKPQTGGASARSRRTQSAHAVGARSWPRARVLSPLYRRYVP